MPLSRSPAVIWKIPQIAAVPYPAVFGNRVKKYPMGLLISDRPCVAGQRYYRDKLPFLQLKFDSIADTLFVSYCSSNRFSFIQTYSVHTIVGRLSVKAGIKRRIYS